MFYGVARSGESLTAWRYACSSWMRIDLDPLDPVRIFWIAQPSILKSTLPWHCAYVLRQIGSSELQTGYKLHQHNAGFPPFGMQMAATQIAENCRWQTDCQPRSDSQSQSEFLVSVHLIWKLSVCGSPGLRDFREEAGVPLRGSRGQLDELQGISWNIKLVLNILNTGAVKF